MRNMGEACTAANRFFVHSTLAADFGEKLSKRLRSCGWETAPRRTDVGPLISQAGLDKVETSWPTP